MSDGPRRVNPETSPHSPASHDDPISTPSAAGVLATVLAGACKPKQANAASSRAARSWSLPRRACARRWKSWERLSSRRRAPASSSTSPGATTWRTRSGDRAGTDLFLSASNAWTDTVQNAGRLVAGTRRDLLSNTLVVVATARDTVDGGGAVRAGHAAVPQRWPWATRRPCPRARTRAPGCSPCDCGGRPLWDAVQARVAPAPDVRAALGLVLADPRVIGIVYRTDQMRLRGPHARAVRGARRTADPLRPGAAGGGRRPGRPPRASTASWPGPEGADVFRRHGFTPLPAPAP